MASSILNSFCHVSIEQDFKNQQNKTMITGKFLKQFLKEALSQITLRMFNLQRLIKLNLLLLSLHRQVHHPKPSHNVRDSQDLRHQVSGVRFPTDLSHDDVSLQDLLL